jgi:hypothetical protein
MLLYAWERYHRPIAITETSGFQENRAEWLRMTMEECMKALNGGIALHGVCLYPCVDIPDWNTGEWAKIGVYDIRDQETLERCPCDDYIEELRRWQKLLGREERVEPRMLAENFGRIDLEAVRRCAREWEARTPGSQAVTKAPEQAPMAQ